MDLNAVGQRTLAWRVVRRRVQACSLIALGFVAGCGGSGSPSAVVTPPTISGTPAASVSVGSTYAFTPSASGPVGAILKFSITNAPAWTTFDSSTGRLSGTPSASDVGTYANITISVGDGGASVSLPPFTITVQPATTGSATLTWTIPTLRTDGTALSNIAGFRIYYGTTPGAYTSTVSIANPAATTYTVTGLVSGTTYYYVATAYDSNNVESQPTNSVSSTVQ